jgi:hypothetical protein
MLAPMPVSRHRPARRTRLRTRGGKTVEIAHGAVLDPAIEMPSVEEALAALDRFGDLPDWNAVRRLVMPTFQRARQTAIPDEGELVTVELPPGITVAFGIDMDVMVARVSRPLLESWDRDLGTLVSQAMDNLRRQARLLTSDYVIHERMDGGYVLKALQPPGGWGSSLLLLPAELERLFGDEPQVLTAPTRSLLMCFPADVDLPTITFLTEEFEALDPNALRLEAFELRGEDLTVLPLPRSDLASAGAAQTS